ncbi:2Fe-2S iron-sulfur cluster-binding protein [Streptomyces sp. NPDC096012]|uniref:2Fe-2S iron-sulfur cluster-binding protein n=1 Tax=Streptomyces sp. NPDC096012 TaxID=3155684 RepID=UPI003369D648
MTDDQHGEGTPQGGGRWNPLPQGDYDDGATAFVKLPEGGIEALLSGDSPLAAPGHGYVPPQIAVTPGTGDPAAPGTWTAPAAGAQWPDPNATHPAQSTEAADRFTYQPGATQHWTFEEPPAPAPAGHDVTGQWSIPVAGGELPDESGEFTTSSLVEQWGGTPPATLPGGAAAPWATDGAGGPWDQPAQPRTPDGPAAPLPDHTGAHPAAPAPAHAPEGPDGYAPHEGYGPGPAGHAENDRPNGPAEDGHAEQGHAGHGRVDAGQSETSGGTAAQAAPGATATRPAQDAETGSGAAPDAGVHGPAVPDAGAGSHGPAEASERPADGPAGHEEPAGPADRRQAATAADTDDASARFDSPATTDPAAATAQGRTDGQGRTDDPASDSAPAPDSDAASADGPEHAAEGAVPGHAADSGSPGTAGDMPEGGTGDTAGDAADDTVQGGAEDPAAPLAPHDDHPLASYVLRVNGADRPVTDAWIGESLLYVLRERLGLAGAKDGCSQGECGSCNVQVEGRLVASCLVPAVTAAGSEVRTVEGLAADGQPSDVQRALARCGAVQCGFCVPGMAMTVHDLLEGNPAPSELETRQALCGNLCRCSGYRGVLDAVKEVVAEREAAHAGPETDAGEARIPHQAGPGSGGVNPSAFEAPGAFDTPRSAPAGYGDAQGGHGEPQGPYGGTPNGYGDAANGYGDPQDGYGDGSNGYGHAPDGYGDAPPDPYGAPGPHDQHYGQDGGQA